MILHIDGDSFFASCEISLNPWLKGKPVVTGFERGIASSMSYEAKAKGIKRGMPIWEIRKTCPDVIIVPSDYDSYRIFSRRMFDIVRRYAEVVEEYSIDECFADLAPYLKNENDPARIAEKVSIIKNDIQKSLGVTFSLGVAETKVLAKVASKWQKPDGLTVIPNERVNKYLKTLPIEKIWGIGMSTSILLWKKGIKTAYDFVSKKREWVEEFLAKPYVEIWYELRGTRVFKIGNTYEPPKSIAKTRTFSGKTADPKSLLSELSKNIESACAKARKHNLKAREISFFIKTTEFSYRSMSVKLPKASSSPEAIIQTIEKWFKEIYKPGILYRTTGVTLRQFVRDTERDLFGEWEKNKNLDLVYEKIDELSQKNGRRQVFLASSLEAIKKEDASDERMETNTLRNFFLHEKTLEGRLRILMMGEVS